MRLAALLLLTATSIAHAAPPEPSGPHPRMLLDKELQAAWKIQAQEERGPVVGAIALCTSGQSGAHDRGLYQGAEWSRVLQACLVAWAATSDPQHATTAIKFFSALLDDKERIGDGGGGETAVQRDSGYVIRNIGPYTALAYDWLHNAPGMTPQLRQHARELWAAWLTWYREKGYRARVPGSNYQAGFLAAATMIAIAQGGEAAEQSGDKLWAFVADELWTKDMTHALAPGGILDGGDWPEGWQYGPLAVAHYSLAARIARRAGIKVDGVEASEITWPPESTAMSSSMALRRSPKPGALTAATLRPPRSLLTTRVARASPSMSSAMISSGFEVWTTASRIGSIACSDDSFFSCRRM